MAYERALELRERLVTLTLEWEAELGVGPGVTSAIAEIDAARLVECPYDEYCRFMQRRTAVSRGHDFELGGLRYQVKANRPSGKPGSIVTLAAKVMNFDWDRLIWILYSKNYRIEEAWIWTVEEFQKSFELKERLSPEKLRRGRQLYPVSLESRATTFQEGEDCRTPSGSTLRESIAESRSHDLEILLTEAHRTLVEWFSEPEAQRCVRWNGNDVTGRYTLHGAVPAAKGSFLLALSWTRDRAVRVDVGCFRLHQEALLESGYIRTDAKPGHNRIRFVHDGQNVLWLQAKAGDPRLALARLPS